MKHPIYSVCTANPFAVEAALRQAKEDGSQALVEATSNQVDQFGGYTGMTPPDFVRHVESIAAAVGLPKGSVILGGDHLGPNSWRKEGSGSAMAKAADLVRAYAAAGFSKLHLDASMRCADDPAGPLSAETVAERTALLCQEAEAAWERARRPGPAPVYVIGTEVPTPGGALESLRGLRATDCADAEATLSLNRKAFLRKGLGSAWERVAALVVQPGVEFSDEEVVDYDRARARGLSKLIEKYGALVYEAHSTDYQSPENLRRMVEDHFAILKVGPWLTFAFREAVFALEDLEKEWLGRRSGVRLSGLRDALEAAMLDDPRHWQGHYRGDEASQAFARKYSLSDRSRYYWPHRKVTAALKRLMGNLAKPVPLSLLSQFMPAQYRALRQGRVRNAGKELVLHRVMGVTQIYSDATGGGRK